jgi:streptogramin lyase
VAAPGGSCYSCDRISLSGITAARDGNVWFFDVGQSTVGRVTPAGVITQYAVPATGSGSRSIVGAPDGNIWMVGRAQSGKPDVIIKVSPAGVVTSFPIGVGVGPESIAWGPDSNIWFTEFWTGRIGRMTPAGKVTEFPAGQSLRGIVAGPDKNLWFVQADFNHTGIVRMTVSGSTTFFPLGGSATDQLQPTEIVSGPDGNLWFTEAGKIGRITTNGVVTTFALPDGSSANGIAFGPDRNLWFTDPFGNAIGRMSPAGDIHKFALPRRNSGPLGIVAGGDGRMWFTEAGSVPNMGSIGTTVPEAKLSPRVLTFNPGSSPNVRAVDVTNAGDAILKIAGVSIVGTDRDSFTTTKDGCSGRALGIKASCRVEVSFASGSDIGVRAARLAISDNGTGSPHSVSLVAQLPDCKLPLFGYKYDSPSSQGAFLSLRDGAVVDDPSGRYVTASSTRLSQSQASPTLTGYMPATYIREAKRWVPSVDRGISPDGSRYAYIEYPQPFEGKLHVVDIASGRDRTLPIEKGPWGLIGFTGDGIYMHQSYEATGPGAMVVNADSGAARTILSDSVVHLVSGRAAWTATRNAADTLPDPGVMGPSHNEVQSRDLITSQKTTWLYRPGSDMYVMAVTSGSIVVSGRDRASNFVLVVTAPGQAIPVTVPDTGEAIAFSGGNGAVADANGWWFGTLDGVFLWTPHTGAILVSDSTAVPVGACA